MFQFLKSISLMLVQTEKEKMFTVVGLAVFIDFLFFLILDSTIKQKYIPKNPAIRGFLIFLMILSIIALGVYFIFVK